MINKLFVGDHIRYQIDQRIGHDIMASISESAPEYRQYPILFLGHYTVPRNPLVYHQQVIGSSFFEHDGGNLVRITAFLNTEGYALFYPTLDEYERAQQYSIDMPSWPDDGSINIINNNMIVVKLSDGPYLDGTLLKERNHLF